MHLISHLILLSVAFFWKPTWSEFTIEDFFAGRILKTADGELPSPFGLNNKKYSRDRSLNCTCGLSGLAALDKRYTTTISPSQAPWLVLIRVGVDSDASSSSRICSGTVINDLVILTTASCLANIPDDGDRRIRGLFKPEHFLPKLDQLHVLLANHTASQIDLDDETSFAKLSVDEVTFNPFFVSQQILSKKFDWDIAFILLRRRLKFTDEAGFVPICLPYAFYTHRGLEGVGMNTLGWVESVETDKALNSTSTVYSLKMTEMLHVHPKFSCLAITSTNWISKRHFCTDGVNLVESVFIETLGAPFLVQSATTPHSMIQFGIVSWDFVGGSRSKKNVIAATNLSGFLQVIEDFSDSVGARWCSRDQGRSEEPYVAQDWDGGLRMSQPIRID